MCLTRGNVGDAWTEGVLWEIIGLSTSLSPVCLCVKTKARSATIPLTVVGASPEAALQLIDHPLYLCRIRQMQAYDSRVFYQSSTNPPYMVHAEQ